ncbi:MAG: SPOR domain-containing protein [Sulfitobacter sp.]
MKFTRIVATAVTLGALAVSSATAQIKADVQPAEFPPSSFNGKQYVDSKGCVFIRAGIDGNVSWIPRVSRNRKGVCGFKPTLAGQVAEAAPAPAPAEAPVRITNPAPLPAPVQKAPAPRAAVQVAAAPRPAPAPKPRPVVVRQTAAQPAPRPAPVPRVAPTPAPVAQVARVNTGQVACPGASALSQQYLTSNGKHAVRCGPQTQAIVGANGRAVAVGQARYAAAAPAPETVDPNARIVPKHVYIQRQNTTNVTVPRGYKKVWKDDRLNPRRAEQTLAGHQQMQLIWTSTVPRRLINQATGRDLTAKVALIYPYTDLATQQRELGEVKIVQRDGQTIKQLRRNANGKRKPVYSSRSAPKKQVAAPARVQPKAAAAPARTAVASGSRYVQVGMFGDPANATRTAQNIQRLGLPARIGNYTRGGKNYRIVVAGPFGNEGALRSALGKVRGAGFSDAYARN